jgi:hypothetical protein
MGRMQAAATGVPLLGTKGFQMATQQGIDWSDVEAASRQLAGNWRDFDCFAWRRGYDLDDADQWAILYTSGRDSGLLAQSNHAEIIKLLAPFTEGDDPDVVAESAGRIVDIRMRFIVRPILDSRDYIGHDV